MTASPLTTDSLVRAYLSAKRAVIENGYAGEIIWQQQTSTRELSPPTFLREAAWVVLSSGMREAIVRAVFARLEGAMWHFDPRALIAHRARARDAALTVFRHERKIDAVLEIAGTVAELDAVQLRAALDADAESFLRSLPYIGPITWRHLAKNLGVDVAKADRHLQRFASAAARSSVDALCAEIGSYLDESVAVVDLVLWRWSVLHAPRCSRSCDPVGHLVEQSLRRPTRMTSRVPVTA